MALSRRTSPLYDRMILDHTRGQSTLIRTKGSERNRPEQPRGASQLESLKMLEKISSQARGEAPCSP